MVLHTKIVRTYICEVLSLSYSHLLAHKKTMNTLVIYAHSNPAGSRANTHIVQALSQLENTEVRALHTLYPDFKIDVAAEQTALEKADLVVLQFPLHWYSVPGILKTWLDNIAIKWPHKAAILCTPERARIVVACLSLASFLYNIPHFFASAIVGGICRAYVVNTPMVQVYSWVTFAINAVIPFTLLIHMNYVIVKTVKNSRKMFSSDNGNTGMGVREKTMKNAESQLTVMLLLVTTLFLIFVFPTYFRYIFLILVKRDTPFMFALSVFLYQLSSKLYATNSGVNFFLYCISGQKFRNDLKEIFCGSKVSKRGISNKTGLRSTISLSRSTEISDTRIS